MYTLQKLETYSQDIKRSRFVATAGPIASEQGAKDFIENHRDASANHNCWAWRIGQAYRFNDDGEPSGTAGKSILTAIDGRSLDAVAVVVTRWFGGILLGSGGLMRAYGGTAAACLKTARLSPIVATVEAQMDCPFASLAIVQARLGVLANVTIREETFTETGARLRVELPSAEAHAIAQTIADMTAGRVVLSMPSDFDER